MIIERAERYPCFEDTAVGTLGVSSRVGVASSNSVNRVLSVTCDSSCRNEYDRSPIARYDQGKRDKGLA